VTDLLLAKANVTLPTATFNVPYTYILQEQGGVGPLNWTLASGTLPPGISLLPSGILRGTPTASGTYTFSVRAVDSSNPQKVLTSGNLTMNMVPLPPTNVAPGPPSSSVANLIWEFSLSPDITGYNIYRASVTGGPYTKIASVSAGTSNYSDPSVQSATTYFYVITAVGQASLESPYSNEVSIVIP